MVKELSGMLVTGNQMVGHLAMVSIESEGDGENLMVCGLRKVWWWPWETEVAAFYGVNMSSLFTFYFIEIKISWLISFLQAFFADADTFQYLFSICFTFSIDVVLLHILHV